MTLPI